MNKNLYLIVFNRALGLFQVVAEIARRNGPGASTGTSAAGSRYLARLGALRFAIALALGQAVIVPLAHAQIVADPTAPGNQRPTVLEAGNGVPLVNIQTPSAAGVSRNTYQQFDVDQKGAILNNSRTNTQTQLGGWVQGNPWLSKQLQLGIPASTSAEQMAAIARAIDYAKSKGIEVVVTKVK